MAILPEMLLRFDAMAINGESSWNAFASCHGYIFMQSF
jgi:hypothetical protein